MLKEGSRPTARHSPSHDHANAIPYCLWPFGGFRGAQNHAFYTVFTFWGAKKRVFYSALGSAERGGGSLGREIWLGFALKVGMRACLRVGVRATGH